MGFSGYLEGRNPLCACGKVSFDKRGAQTKANMLMRRSRERMRIYHCPESDTWHLSKEKQSNGYHFK